MKKMLFFLVSILLFGCSSSNDSVVYDENADNDRDSVTNLLEDLNQDGNPDNDDTDGDGIPNYLDNDDDGDGVLTIEEDYDGDGYVYIDDEDCDGVVDYLDAILFEEIQGTWKLITASNKYRYLAFGSNDYSNLVLNRDTLKYNSSSGASSKAIYKAIITINYPVYEYNNFEYQGIGDGFQKDTTYTNTFTAYNYPNHIEHNGVFVLSRYLNPSNLGGYNQGNIVFCNSIGVTKDTLKFDFYYHLGNFSAITNEYTFVRE